MNLQRHRRFTRGCVAIRGRRFAWVSLLLLLFAMWAQAAPRWAVAVFPSGEEFSLEVAADADARAYGYMFRDTIAPNEGMLFVFDRPGPYTFWMKNCKVALDIVWLDEDLRVVDIAHDRQPCPEDGECPSVGPMKVARYVIEVAAGTARREGLERGDRVTILSEPALP
jgi:uncharacterized membrane protein (UPF0127 family)